MSGTTTPLYSLGDLAALAGAPVHRIDYFIKTHQIEPVARCGRYRVFGADTLDTIRRHIGRAGTVGGDHVAL